MGGTGPVSDSRPCVFVSRTRTPQEICGQPEDALIHSDEPRQRVGYFNCHRYRPPKETKGR